MIAFAEVDESDYDSEEEEKSSPSRPRKSFGSANRHKRSTIRGELRDSVISGTSAEEITGESKITKKSALQTALDKAKLKHDIGSGEKIHEEEDETGSPDISTAGNKRSIESP